MSREHRILDGATGKLTVVPFTSEEEAIADQKEADALAAANTPEARTKKARAEYPSFSELIEALVEERAGDPLKINTFLSAVIAAQQKHGV